MTILLFVLPLGGNWNTWISSSWENIISGKERYVIHLKKGRKRKRGFRSIPFFQGADLSVRELSPFLFIHHRFGAFPLSLDFLRYLWPLKRPGDASFQKVLPFFSRMYDPFTKPKSGPASGTMKKAASKEVRRSHTMAAALMMSESASNDSESRR